jgi:hypothetical protein
VECLSSRELTGDQFRSVLNITAEEKDGSRKANSARSARDKSTKKGRHDVCFEPSSSLIYESIISHVYIFLNFCVPLSLPSCLMPDNGENPSPIL